MLFLPAALCAFSLLSFSARAAGEMPRQAMPFITAIEAGEEPNTLRMRFSHGAAPAAAGYRLTVWINDVLLQVRTLSPAADKVWEYPLNSPLTGGDTVRFTVQAIGDYQTTSHSLTNTMQVVIRRLTAPEEPQVSQGIIDDGGQGRLILRFRRVANARAYGSSCRSTASRSRHRLWSSRKTAFMSRTHWKTIRTERATCTVFPSRQLATAC